MKLSVLYAHEEWVSRGLLQAALGYVERGQREKAERFAQELQQRFPNSDAAKEVRTRLSASRGGR